MIALMIVLFEYLKTLNPDAARDLYNRYVGDPPTIATEDLHLHSIWLDELNFDDIYNLFEEILEAFDDIDEMNQAVTLTFHH